MGTLAFKTKDENGKELDVVLNSPTATQLKEAQIVSAGAFQEAVKNKLMFREKLQDYLREQGIWDDQKEQELLDVTGKLNDGERRLKRGGAGGFTKAQARDLALQMRKWRVRQAELLSKTRELDVYTVQAYAENARFDYLVSACSKYDDGRKIFSGLDDYREKANLSYAIEIATKFAKLMNDFDEDWEKKLPENEFLIKYKFANEGLMLVNEKGQLVDESGKLINDQGRYINENNEYVDREGNKVDANGNPLEEFVAFPEDVVTE